MMPEGVERRLRAHVAQVLEHANVPARDRDDVAEELFGHLAERWQALTDGGMEPMRAMTEAVRSFGTARRIGADLTRTFRGRFWASTIGVLLPVVAIRGPRPRIAWWLGASLWVYGTLAAVGAVVAATGFPPVRALLVLVVGVGTGAIYVVAATALGRRQRWGLDVAVIANVIGLVTGVVTMLSSPGLISLNVFFSGGLLLIAANEGERLRTWVRRSRSVNGALAVAILATILGGALLPVSANEIPDPSQAGPGDLHISATMSCRDSVPKGGTVTVELRWDRLDVLPGGIARIAGYGDMLVLEMHSELAYPFGYSFLTDMETGEAVAEPNVFPPSGERVTQDSTLSGPALIGIEHGKLEADRRYRLTWEFDAWDDTDMRDLQAGVEYWHVDQFRTETLLSCEGTVLDWWSVPLAGS